MVTIEVQETTFHDLTLEAEPRVTRGKGSLPEHLLNGWVSLGEPVAVSITSGDLFKDDDALRQLVEAQSAKYRYHLIYLACTFRAREGEPFVNAYLEVRLAHLNGDQEKQPIAISMRPFRLENPVEISRTVNLGASVPLVPQVINAETGIELTETATQQDIFLEALNEGQSNPVWGFYRTARAEIRGMHRLFLITRTPTEVAGTGTVKLSATVQRKHFGIIPYIDPYPNSPQQSFHLT